MNSKEIIHTYGGPTALARKLGYRMPGGAQRCGNWARRGIPAAVKLDHPDLFLTAHINPPEQSGVEHTDLLVGAEKETGDAL